MNTLTLQAFVIVVTFLLCGLYLAGVFDRKKKP